MRFLQAAWQQEPPESTQQQKAQHGERFPRYRIERTFARFLHGWIAHKARVRRLGEEENKTIGWHLGVDLAGLSSPDRNRLRLEVHGVRPTIRLRSDGRSKVELLIVLGQRLKTDLLADPDDPASVMKGPDGTPLSFWFRGGSTLIVDPEAGAVTYSIGKNLLSDARRRRHMAFLRDRLAQLGSTAIVRLGLTDEMRERQRGLEPFALAHGRVALSGTY
jgi:hypothetical protein